MKIYTSYFYQVRHFKDNMLPMSTAMWDPKWFHENKSQKHVFIDKNGIINGARAVMFTPGDGCDGLCYGPEKCSAKGPKKCEFLKVYKKQLSALKFDKVIDWFNNCTTLLDTDKEPIIVLLFHEKPDNPCSERWTVIDWFSNHGMDVQELSYPIKDHY